MEKPELGSATVLNQWEKEGRRLTKWELCRIVKELRKYKRYDRALEVIIREKINLFGILFGDLMTVFGLMGIYCFS